MLTTVNNQQWLGIRSDGRFYSYLGTVNGSSYSLGGGDPVNANQWYHVALTYDGSILRLYVNGVMVANQARAMPGNLGNMLVGPNFPGLLDELVIFKRALSASEVSALASVNPWVTATISASPFSAWSQAVPANLADGPYKIDLWAMDTLGNVNYLPNAWSGEIDTHAPTLNLTYNNNSDGTATVACQANDYNLSQSGWACPISPVITASQRADWYQHIFGDTGQLAQLSTATQTISSTAVSLTACDAYGHCATAGTTNGRMANKDLQGFENLAGLNVSTFQSTSITPRAATRQARQSNLANFAVTLTSNGQVLRDGETVDKVKNPLLTATWTGTGDIASYQVQWLVMPSGVPQTLVAQNKTFAANQTSDSFQTSEATKVTLQVTAILTDGRELVQSVGPIYVDYGTTPVYVDNNQDLQGSENLAGQYHGWLNNRCNLIGEDDRLAKQSFGSGNQTQ